MQAAAAAAAVVVVVVVVALAKFLLITTTTTTTTAAAAAACNLATTELKLPVCGAKSAHLESWRPRVVLARRRRIVLCPVVLLAAPRLVPVARAVNYWVVCCHCLPQLE